MTARNGLDGRQSIIILSRKSLSAGARLPNEPASTSRTTPETRT
nr:hypothetical protein REQ54_03126 [Rhizobium sp. Q54]